MTVSYDSKQQYSAHTSETAKNRPYIKMSNKDSWKIPTALLYFGVFN